MAEFVKAIFVKKRNGQGADQWRRADVNLVRREFKNASGVVTSYTTALEGTGHTPGRARVWNTADGEVYDDVLFFDTWPETWPSIGNVHG